MCAKDAPLHGAEAVHTWEIDLSDPERESWQVVHRGEQGSVPCSIATWLGGRTLYGADLVPAWDHLLAFEVVLVADVPPLPPPASFDPEDERLRIVHLGSSLPDLDVGVIGVETGYGTLPDLSFSPVGAS